MSTAEDVLSLIRCRRSVRRFKSDPLPRELVLQVVELACWAPSFCGRWQSLKRRCPILREHIVCNHGTAKWRSNWRLHIP